jgi:CHAD domain-containing protein
MHSVELAILLHHALEVRLARLQELLDADHWAEDPEQLHQVRVAARRLGAVLDLVDADIYPGHKGQRRALKGLVDTLGLSRELDVHAEHLQAYHHDARSATQAAVIEHLLEQVDRQRAKARKLMEKELGKLHLPDLRRLLEVPTLPNPFQSASLQEAAWVCLEPRAAAALGELTTLAAHEDPTALHKTRVRIKKLRYAVEALEGAFSDLPEAVLKGLRSFQSVLGEHHDLAALEALLWEAEAQLRGRGRLTLCSGLLEILGDVAETRRAAFDRFVALARVQDPSTFAAAIRPALGLPPVDGLLA